MQMADNVPAELMITRLFDAPRELVWKAWTEPEHLAQWWGPNECTNTDCVVQLRVNGHIGLNMHAPNGETYPCRGRFLEIIAPERLVIEGDPLSPHPCGAGLPPKAIITVTFEAQGDKTRLTLHTRFGSITALQAADSAGYVVGWDSTLNRLKAYL